MVSAPDFNKLTSSKLIIGSGLMRNKTKGMKVVIGVVIKVEIGVAIEELKLATEMA